MKGTLSPLGFFTGAEIYFIEQARRAQVLFLTFKSANKHTSI